LALQFCLPAAAFSEPLVDHLLITKYGWVGDERFCTWEHDGLDTSRFEVEVTHFENRIVTNLVVDDPTARQARFVPSRAGHYTCRVRACNDELCSDWRHSDEDGWWIFVWIKPPGF
jgi:hypothetical protein